MESSGYIRLSGPAMSKAKKSYNTMKNKNRRNKYAMCICSPHSIQRIIIVLNK